MTNLSNHCDCCGKESQDLETIGGKYNACPECMANVVLPWFADYTKIRTYVSEEEIVVSCWVNYFGS